MQFEVEAGLIGIQEIAKRLAISTRSVWRIIARGELHIVRIGRRSLLSRAEIERWLAGTPGCAPHTDHHEPESAFHDGLEADNGLYPLTKRYFDMFNNA